MPDEGAGRDDRLPAEMQPIHPVALVAREAQVDTGQGCYRSRGAQELERACLGQMMQKTFRIEIGEGLGHVMDDALVETVGDFPPPVTLRQCHHAEGKREGASQASASLFTATLQPTKFARAPSDIENQDMRLLWFKKRCATLVGEGCFFRAVDDHTSELQSHENLVCRPRLEKKTHE